MLMPSFFIPSLLLPKASMTLPCTGQTKGPLPVPAAGPADFAASAASTAASVSASICSGVFGLVAGAVAVCVFVGAGCGSLLSTGSVGVGVSGTTLGVVDAGDGTAGFGGVAVGAGWI